MSFYSSHDQGIVVAKVCVTFLCCALAVVRLLMGEVSTDHLL